MSMPKVQNARSSDDGNSIVLAVTKTVEFKADPNSYGEPIIVLACNYANQMMLEASENHDSVSTEFTYMGQQFRYYTGPEPENATTN